jgi:hypothetical protein
MIDQQCCSPMIVTNSRMKPRELFPRRATAAERLHRCGGNPTTQRSREELAHLLAKIWQAPKLSSDAYERGSKGPSKRVAPAVRALVHDPSQSHSLPGQLGSRGARF